MRNRFREIHFIKASNNRVLPATERDKEVWDKVPVDAQFAAAIRLPRNPRHHRMTWALISKIADNWPGEYRPSSEEVMRWLKMKTGLVIVIRDLETMEFVAIPSSTDFASMPQQEYAHWWQSEALPAASNAIGVNSDDLAHELNEVAQWGKCANPDCGNKASERHHIFGGMARRERSDVLGYVIDICRTCHDKSHGKAYSPLSQEEWSRLWCRVKGLNYEEARGKVFNSEKIYRLQKN